MNWWAVPVIGVLGVLGLLVGWTVGTIILALRDEPMDVWWDEDENLEG